MLNSKFLFFGLICVNGMFAQTDTLFSYNEKTPCIVREITEESVKYSFVGEELVNSVYKNAITKIHFKNGRVQTFSESTSFKPVKTVDDFQNVTISQVEGEVKGLFKLGDVSAKAKGFTVISNQERVKERAYRKFKIQAAIMGANIIYLTNQRTQGSIFGGKYDPGQRAETNLTGVAYSNSIPNIDEFKKLINNKKSFIATNVTKLWSAASNLSHNEINKTFTLKNITNENGLIILEGHLQGIQDCSKFRVVNFNEDSFNIYYESYSKMFNYTISL